MVEVYRFRGGRVRRRVDGRRGRGLFGRQGLDGLCAEVVLPRHRRLFPVLRSVAPLEPVWQHPVGEGRRQSRIHLFLVVRHAVRRRHGHRLGVLDHRRAHVSLPRQPVHGRGIGEDAASGAARHAHHVLPLGPAPVGDLCGRRHGAGLLRLSQGPAADHPIGALSPYRGQDLRSDRARRRYPGRVRHGLRRRHVSRPRRAADGNRSARVDGPRHVRRRRHRRQAIAQHDGHADPYRHHFGRRHLVGDVGRGPRHQDPERGKPVAVDRRSGLPVCFRADPLPAQLVPPRHGRLYRLDYTAEPVVGRQQRHRVARLVDRLLLGLVDFVGAVRRHVYRPYLKGPDHPRVHLRRALGADGAGLRLADGVRRHGAAYRAVRGRRTPMP